MNNTPLALTRAIVVLGLLTSISQGFDPIGFEGNLTDIPYDASVGIPNGTPVGGPISYNFTPGNNLQSFRNSNLGIPDSDDGTPNTNGSAVPDYYKSPSFGWKLDGWNDTNNTSATFNTFNSTFVGNGAGNGTDYTGGVAGRTTELSEALNVNRFFSPASGNLAQAPGLGDQFLDTHGKPGFSSQISLKFTATSDDEYYTTLGFGGRDNGSATARGYYQLIDSNNLIIFSGSTSDNPFESWTPIDPLNPSNGAVLTNSPADTGVTQKDWEYFKNTFNVVANETYTLQLLLPEEQNFDFVLGSTYTNTPGIEIISQVPEPESLGALVISAICIGLRRRRRDAAR
jgi:hypothetical protein